MFHVKHFDSVTSTNDIVKAEIAAGTPEGFVACARAQTGGYGRQGRKWESPRGGLYFSLLLRPHMPASEIPTLSLVVALSIRRALASFPHIFLKWPNDLVVGDELPFAKLCGISCEAVHEAVCVGIGINIERPAYEVSDAENVSRETFSAKGDDASKEMLAKGGSAEGASAEEEKNARAYLAEIAPVSSSEILDAILHEIEAAYKQWQLSGFAPFQKEYEAHNILCGRGVSIQNIVGGEVASGTVLGVSERGRLILRAQDGIIREISSGEVHIQSIEEVND